MKVLQVGKFYPIRGGVEKVMYDLTLALSESGIACDMLCATTENAQPGELILNDLAKLIVVPTKVKVAATMLAPSMLFKLRSIASGYDIIHIHHPDPMACLALFLSGFKGKVVLHWHSDIVKQLKLLKFYAPLQSWLIKRADIIVGTTPVYVQCSPFLREVQSKVDFIPIGIDPIQHNNLKVQEIRSRYLGKKIVFSLGRLVEYKGYEYLINSMKYLPSDYHLIIGGKGPLKTFVLDKIKGLGLKERIDMLDYISDEDLPNYFAACDVFCLSSILKTEAFGIVQLEAMSAGKPVVCTAIPGSGVDWVNRHGVSGHVVPIEDSEALAKAIKEVTTDSVYYARLSEGAKKRYLDYFTRKAMEEKCLEIYNRILS